MPSASNHALQRRFMPQLPQILGWIEQGARLLEVR
jgi:hypothetical protein